MLIDQHLTKLATLADEIQLSLNKGGINKTYHQHLHSWNEWPKTNREHMDLINDRSGVKPEEKQRGLNYGLEGQVIDQMKTNNIRARKEQIITRLVWEMRTRPDAYVVFNTLTIKGEYEQKVFGPGSYAWQQYLAKFHWQLYGTTKRPETSSYGAVVEKGTETGRLHIHVVHVVDQCPGDDPNKGSVRPTKREIESLKGCWAYGYSAPIAVRTDPRDAYAQAGWLWPVARTKGGDFAPVKGSINAIASYIGKYVAKAYNANKQEGIKTWRTRMSRNLGMMPIREAIREMQDHHLLEILNTELPTLKAHLRRVPGGRLKLEAAREILRRNPSHVQKITGLEPEPSVIERVRNLWTRPTWISKTQRNGNSSTEPGTETIEALEKAFKDEQGKPGITTGPAKGYR